MRIELASGTTAELVVPDEGADVGLVVVPDIMGLRPLFDDLVARLASEQRWAVCAFELFAGHEDLDLQGRFAHARQLDDGRILGDALAAAEATGADRVGLIGFCMGGMYALKSVATGRFARVCPFYGMITVPDDWAGAGQGQPLDAVRAGDPGSVLAIIGTDDPYTPADEVDALEATGATVVRYPGAEHGFVHDPDRDAHRAADAADAWERVIAWLRTP